MDIKWAWYDAAQTILWVTCIGPAAPTALETVTESYWPVIAAQPHTVDVIFDIRQAHLPLQPLSALIWTATHRPRNAGRLVMVIRRPSALALVRALNRTVSRLYPRFNILGALTVEEAVTILTALREDDTRELPVSSLAQADNQWR